MTEKTFTPGERVVLDRSLQVTFVRHLGDTDAIVELAGATRVTPLYALSRLEA